MGPVAPAGIRRGLGVTRDKTQAGWVDFVATKPIGIRDPFLVRLGEFFHSFARLTHRLWIIDDRCVITNDRSEPYELTDRNKEN